MGYIKLDRKIIDWEWFDDDRLFKLWIYILLSVNYEDNKWHGIEIPKGSFITSIDHLSKRCKISTQKTRTFLKKLENTQEITIKTTNKYTQIYVNKWEEYQCCGDMLTNNLTNKQQTNNKQITTTNKYKKYKNKRIYNDLPTYNTDDEIKMDKNELERLLKERGKVLC